MWKIFRGEIKDEELITRINNLLKKYKRKFIINLEVYDLNNNRITDEKTIQRFLQNFRRFLQKQRVQLIPKIYLSNDEGTTGNTNS
ncbi:MAG: hypothetical protein KatS3mg096_734 [Candidatus Parcubacteria bacterium]|nr:MAG: hypothetical protein KatS3mg096_734 [Candidatus Parcubacteria bacterium]